MKAKRATISILLLVTLALALPAGASLGAEEPQQETITKTGYCTNPDDNTVGSVWEQEWTFPDTVIVSVSATLRWSDDEGTSSEADVFRLDVDSGTSGQDDGGSGQLSVSMVDLETFETDTIIVQVALTEAGPTPRGPLGILTTPDPGNSWQLELVYTYVPAEPDEEPDGPPPSIRALYSDPIFWTHVAFMIASTYMFGIVGLLAGVVLVFGNRWREDANRWKRALSTNRPFRALAVHAWLVFFVAAIPLGMYVAGKAYGWENMWTSFPVVWNPWFYQWDNADHVSLIVLVLFALPLWINREELVARRPHAWLFGRIGWFRKLAADAPGARLTGREMAIIYFIMGVFIFLLFMVQPHGN